MTEAKYYKIKQLAVDLFTSNGIIALQGSPEKLDCNFSFDIDPISKYLNELYQSDAPLPESDHQLSLKIHDMLTDGKIPEHFINDMRFWQWISIECFSEYIGWRWQINHLQPTANRYLGGEVQLVTALIQFPDYLFRPRFYSLKKMVINY